MNLFYATAPAGGFPTLRPAGSIDASFCNQLGVDPSLCQNASSATSLKNQINFQPPTTPQQQQQQQGLVAGLGVVSTLLQGIASVSNNAITQDALTRRTALAVQAQNALNQLSGAASQLSLTDPTGAAQAQQQIAQLQAQLASMQGQQSGTMSSTMKYALIAAGGLLLVGGLLVVMKSRRGGARQNPSYRRSRRHGRRRH